MQAIVHYAILPRSALPLQCFVYNTYSTCVAGVVPNTPTFLLHLQLSFESLFLATLQAASTNLINLQASLRDTNNNTGQIDRTGRWETHGHANTHAAAPSCSHRGETFPKRVNHRTIQMVQCIIPHVTTNLLH